jgi:hypothetical protein
MDSKESKNAGSRLRELGGSDFEIKDEQPNIKGWKVENDSGQTIGKVDELIFDTQALKVRYMVIDLEDNEWNMNSREVLVPIGLAELDSENDHVILPGVTLDQILLLPDYHENDLTPETEGAVRDAFATAEATEVLRPTERPDDFYNHEHFDENRLYRRRRSGDINQRPDDPFI